MTKLETKLEFVEMKRPIRPMRSGRSLTGGAKSEPEPASASASAAAASDEREVSLPTPVGARLVSRSESGARLFERSDIGESDPVASHGLSIRSPPRLVKALTRKTVPALPTRGGNAPSDIGRFLVSL